MSVDYRKLKASAPMWSADDMKLLTTRMNSELGYKSLIIGIEELSELTKAVTKYMRFSTGNRSNKSNYNRNKMDVTEEIADVCIALNVFKNRVGISDDELNRMISYKIDKKFDILNSGNMAR